MSKETIDLMVDGGKASAGATMGASLGPMGVNIQNVLKLINEKTIDFKGMQVPVKVIVDTQTKEVEITVGTPFTSELIKKELGIEKGSGVPHKIKVGNLAIEQVIKMAKMKRDSMLANNLKSAVKNVVGTCAQMGVLVEGKEIKIINEEINTGKYDKEINAGKTEMSEEKIKLIKEQTANILEVSKKEEERLKAEKEAAEKLKEEKKAAKAAAEAGAPAAGAKTEEAPKVEAKKEEKKK